MAAHVMATTPKAASLQPLWHISSGDEIRLDIEAAVDWPPGPYDISLLVETYTSLPPDVMRVADGIVKTGATALEITGDARPGDDGAGVQYTPPEL